MKVRITMINGEIFEFGNAKTKNLLDFIEYQINKDYFVTEPKLRMAIRTSNILKVEHLDIEPGSEVNEVGGS